MFTLAASGSMRPWQTKALAAWKSAGSRGIVSAATGTGKTRLALEAIVASDADRVVVIVPTNALQDQWVRQLRDSFGLSRSVLGTIGGRRPAFTFEHSVVVAVINSARDRLTGVMAYWQRESRRVFLIVDECHWAGSEQAERLFREPPTYVLGLSATPERDDGGFEELMVPNLGEVVYRYPLKRAIDDGAVSEIVSSHFLFGLTSGEQRDTERMTARIREIREQISKQHPALGVGPGWEQRLSRLAREDPAALQLQRLLDERRSAIREAAGRADCFSKLASSGYLERRRTLVFNETISQASRIAGELRRMGLVFALEHSQLPAPSRGSALSRFASGAVPILVAVRALDEGIDIPEANVAVIVSGSLNTRKRIQRIGRIARVSQTGAEVVSILARNSAEESDTFLVDTDLLGQERVRRIDLEAFRGSSV